MEKDNLVKNDLQNLLCVLEDVLDRIFDLNCWDDDDEFLSLGLNHLYKQIYLYMRKYYEANH